MKEPQLVRQADFCGLLVDFYGDPRGEFYMSREQIGRALGYRNPQKAIDNLHARKKKRLDPLCVTLNLRGKDGKQTERKLYTAKGVYEICRWSNKPNANRFYDFVYEMLDGLRLGRLRLEIEKSGEIWQDTRTLAKQVRKQEADTIRQLVLYAQSQGSENAAFYYSNLSRLAHKAAGVTDRDTATTTQLLNLYQIEAALADEIQTGIKKELPYREIYVSAKNRIAEMADIFTLPLLLSGSATPDAQHASQG